ncbi:MAG: 4'-phosphopantetheinyl transferase superfamily protein [Magnetococcus sp. DMHC-1]|nr:4'-phosphopantetheinyl transferase superfamily protein [Magnetococcales bacterium]
MDCIQFISDNEIHIWFKRLDPSPFQINTLYVFLSKEEQQRADRFHYAKHRIEYIVAHSFLRFLLGRYLITSPTSVHFHITPYGKPYLKATLDGSKPPLYFSLSHSGEWGVVAIARNNDLGVDLEKIRPAHPLERLDFAQRFFSNDEFANLKKLPEEQVNTAFFACWTRKEAYIKCLGVGLSHPLSGFTVNVNPEETRSVMTPRCLTSASELAFPHQIHDLPAEPGYRAALAVATSGPSVPRIILQKETEQFWTTCI